MKKKIWISIILIGFCSFIIAENVKEQADEKEVQQTITTDIDLLISTGGDPLRKTFLQEVIEHFENANSDYQLHTTFVESDTLAFLKLLYSEGEQKYDIVALGEESVVSASEQGLVYPLDDFVLRDLGFEWLNEVPAACMENTVNQGKIYSLPFVKSNLYYYSKTEEIKEEKITIWEVLENSSEIGKIGIPAYVIVKDILVSRTPDQWEMKDGKIPYIVNTFFNQELLQLLDKGKDDYIVFEENYESAVEDYREGKINGVFLDENYENILINENGMIPNKGRLYITNSSPWFLQGCNLFLVKKRNSGDYEESWEVLKGLVGGQKDKWKNSIKDERVIYKRISSQYNPKIQLIVDRMISEFLHGDYEVAELLENLQNQVQNIQEMAGIGDGRCIRYIL